VKKRKMCQRQPALLHVQWRDGSGGRERILLPTSKKGRELRALKTTSSAIKEIFRGKKLSSKKNENSLVGRGSDTADGKKKRHKLFKEEIATMIWTEEERHCQPRKAKSPRGKKRTSPSHSDV